MLPRTIISRTGLAMALTGFVFYILIGPSINESRAQDDPPAPSDSALLARHIHDTKVEYAIEEFSDHSFNAHLDDKELDSILREQKITITGGKVYYSPDSAFKILVVEGESCGAYCNPIWNSWLHFNDGSQYVLNNTEFHGDISIEIMPDGKYLVIQSSWCRPASVFSASNITAVLISFDNHQLVKHGFRVIDNGGWKTMNAFFCTQEHFIDSSQYVQYDAQAKRLNYQYGNDLNYCCQVDSAYIYKGYFKYSNGQFVEEQNTRHSYKSGQ